MLQRFSAQVLGCTLALAGALAAWTATPAPSPDLGMNGDLHGARPFPDDNAWNTPIDEAPVDAASDQLIDSIGANSGLHPDFGANYNGGPFGIPYVVVSGNQPKVPMSFAYADESDPGPYPIPANAPVEGGAGASGDRHVLVVDRDHWMLWETWDSHPRNGGWRCGSGARFDLGSNRLRPQGWTSADAAGLPIFPGLVRYDEVVGQGAILHALRFTVQKTRRAYLYPARHFASDTTSSVFAPMGMRVRLKGDFDISRFPAQARVVLQALKTYGMILADNGSNWFISGTPDARWDDDQLNSLKQVQGRNLEVVRMDEVPQPEIDSFAPPSGEPETRVAIVGTGFSGATAVKLHHSVTQFEVLSPTTLTAVVPPGATNGPLEVFGPGGIGVSDADFVVPGSAPELSSLSLRAQSVKGGKRVGGVLSFSGAVLADAVVQIVSSQPAAARVAPAKVLVPAGRAAVSFTVRTKAVRKATPVTFTAVFGGITRQVTLTVKPSTPRE